MACSEHEEVIKTAIAPAFIEFTAWERNRENPKEQAHWQQENEYLQNDRMQENRKLEK